MSAPRPVASTDLPATARIEPARPTAGSMNDQLVDIFFDRVPMGVAVFDRDARLVRCNRTWAGFFVHYMGVTADYVTPGRTLHELIPDNEEAIAPLLWLRVGAVGERIDHVAEGGWAIPSDAVYGVLFDTSAWGAFVAAAALRDDLVHAFVVTDSIVEYQQVVARLDPSLKTTRLYADYLRSFEINTGA